MDRIALQHHKKLSRIEQKTTKRAAMPQLEWLQRSFRSKMPERWIFSAAKGYHTSVASDRLEAINRGWLVRSSEACRLGGSYHAITDHVSHAIRSNIRLRRSSIELKCTFRKTLWQFRVDRCNNTKQYIENWRIMWITKTLLSLVHY